MLQTHVKVVEGKVVDTKIPRNGILPNGRAVSNFHLLPDDFLKELGWIRVEEEPVKEIDPLSQEIGPAEFEVKEDKVIRRFPVLPRREEPKDRLLELESRVSALEAVVEGLKGEDTVRG